MNKHTGANDNEMKGGTWLARLLPLKWFKKRDKRKAGKKLARDLTKRGHKK